MWIMIFELIDFFVEKGTKLIFVKSLLRLIKIVFRVIGGRSVYGLIDLLRRILH
jgi:hypothetical protein